MNFHYNPIPLVMELKDSPIHGKGLFAAFDLPKDQPLGMSHVAAPVGEEKRFQNGLIRTPIGGFINHSEEPNCYLQIHDGLGVILTVYWLMTLREIKEGEELTIDYTKYSQCGYND